MLLFSTEPLRHGFEALRYPEESSLASNSDHYFTIASTFKLPLAIYCLQNEASLDEVVTVAQTDLRYGSGILKRDFSEPIELSVRELIKLMMIYSDNTATDILLNRLGGPVQLTKWLRSIGIEEITLQNSCQEVLASFCGIESLPDQCTLEQFEACKQQVSPEAANKAAEAYFQKMPDKATPRAMILLLQKLMKGELISSNSREFLLNCMQQSAMGYERIRKYLPKHLFAADKVGTLGNLTADVGMVQLPGENEYLFIAAYVQGGESLAAREEFIAKLSFDAFEQLP